MHWEFITSADEVLNDNFTSVYLFLMDCYRNIEKTSETCNKCILSELNYYNHRIHSNQKSY